MPNLGGGKIEEIVGAELRTGPVAITGADGHVGRHLQARLTALPNPVRRLKRHDEWAAGIKGAEAVVHLAGTLLPRPPDTYQSANADTVRRLAAALTDTVNRIVFLSYLGADPESDNPYLRAKGEAEKLIRATGVPGVIFRSSFVYGNPEDIGPSFASYQSRAGKPVSVLGNGTQKLAPIHVGDLTDMLIAAALSPQTPTGTFEVGGPDIVCLDDLVRRLNPPETRIRHLSPAVARLLARLTPSLTPTLVRVLLADSVPSDDAAETAGRFRVTLRHLPDRAKPASDSR